MYIRSCQISDGARNPQYARITYADSRMASAARAIRFCRGYRGVARADALK